MTNLHPLARDENIPAHLQGHTPLNLCALTVRRIAQDHHHRLRNEGVENPLSPCVVGPRANPATMVVGRHQNLKIGWRRSPRPLTGMLLHSADVHPPQDQVHGVEAEARALMNAVVRYIVCPPPMHQPCNQLCKPRQSLLPRESPRRTRRIAQDKL